MARAAPGQWARPHRDPLSLGRRSSQRVDAAATHSRRRVERCVGTFLFTFPFAFGFPFACSVRRRVMTVVAW